MPTSTATDTIGQVSAKALSVYSASIGFVEFFAILISVALFVGIVMIIIKTGWFTARVDRVRHVVLKADMPRKGANEAWKKAQTHFFAGNDNDLKIAIMQADSLLEDALRFAGVRGSNMGERLKNLKKTEVPNLDQIWQAHKLRNQIAHEANTTVRRDLAERTLSIYEEALRNLGVLDEGK